MKLDNAEKDRNITRERELVCTLANRFLPNSFSVTSRGGIFRVIADQRQNPSRGKLASVNNCYN